MLTPNPKAHRSAYAARRRSSGDHETWVEGLNVYHNPDAEEPMGTELFPGGRASPLRERRPREEFGAGIALLRIHDDPPGTG